MTRRIPILLLLAALVPGCVSYHHAHTMADGSKIDDKLVRFAMNDSFQNAIVREPDGTFVYLGNFNSVVDPASVAAMQTLGQAILVWGQNAAKLMIGVP